MPIVVTTFVVIILMLGGSLYHTKHPTSAPVAAHLISR